MTETKTDRELARASQPDMSTPVAFEHRVNHSERTCKCDLCGHPIGRGGSVGVMRMFKHSKQPTYRVHAKCASLVVQLGWTEFDWEWHRGARWRGNDPAGNTLDVPLQKGVAAFRRLLAEHMTPKETKP